MASGYLLIDNSNAPPLPGLPNTKVEYEAKGCGHCGACIAVLRRGCNTFHLSSIDVARATVRAPEAGEKYVGKFRCRRCDKNVCRRCAMWMTEHGGTCPGPFRARVEAAISRKRADDEFVYQYRSVSR